MISTVARRNARLVIACSFFGNLTFVLPIWLLYSINYLHFSPLLASVIMAGMYCAMGLFEIPTGALADRLGRRRMFIIGTSLFLIFPLMYVIQAPVIAFFVAMIIAGFGTSLASGALVPLVHAAYEDAGLSKRAYHHFFVKSQAALFSARVVAGVGGAWLYTINPALPFLAWGIAAAITIPLALIIKETRSAASETTYRAHIATTFKAMLKSEVVVALSATTIVVGLVTEAIWAGYQVFYEQDGRSDIVIGVLFSVIALFGAITTYLSRHSFSRVRPQHMMLIGSALTLLTAALIYQDNIALRLLAVIPMAIAAGFMYTIATATVQGVIANKFQSTALSILSTTTYVTFFVGTVWIGAVITWWGLDVARTSLLAGGIISLCIVAIITIRTRHNSFMLEEKKLQTQ